MCYSVRQLASQPAPSQPARERHAVLIPRPGPGPWRAASYTLHWLRVARQLSRARAQTDTRARAKSPAPLTGQQPAFKAFRTHTPIAGATHTAGGLSAASPLQRLPLPARARPRPGGRAPGPAPPAPSRPHAPRGRARGPGQDGRPGRLLARRDRQHVHREGPQRTSRGRQILQGPMGPTGPAAGKRVEL